MGRFSNIIECPSHFRLLKDRWHIITTYRKDFVQCRSGNVPWKELGWLLMATLRRFRREGKFVGSALWDHRISRSGSITVCRHSASSDLMPHNIPHDGSNRHVIHKMSDAWVERSWQTLNNEQGSWLPRMFKLQICSPAANNSSKSLKTCLA